MLTKFKSNKKATIRLLKVVTHLGALIPLLLLIWDYRNGQLGVDPVREVTLRTGKSTLILLILTLAVTPATILFNWKQLLPVRRLLGLYTFFYVSLHLLSFIGLDYFFNWRQIVGGIVEQRYVLVGFAAFLLLAPLAATSNRWSMRRLGKKWKPLHRLVYVAAILAILHFLWLVKNVYTEPIIYGSIVGLLLLSRLNIVKQRILRWPHRPRSKQAARLPSPGNGARQRPISS
jgi:sulfoxide reductase heme-binding subunit YedZ